MNAFFSTTDGVVLVRMTAESADGLTIGDFAEEVRAGQDFAGVSYDALVAAEAGEIAFDTAGAGSIVVTGAIDAAFDDLQPPQFALDRDDLTSDHEEVVRWFQVGGHRLVNANLRDGAAATPEVHDNIRLLHEAVGHATVTRSGIVYRAVTVSEFNIDDIDAKFGHVITWNGFTSTTTDERVARRRQPEVGSPLFRILLPQGATALQYALLSGRGPRESDDPSHEVILPAGARFVVRETAGLVYHVTIDIVMLRGPADGKEQDDE